MEEDKKPSTAQQVATVFDRLEGAASKLLIASRQMVTDAKLIRVTVRILIPLALFLALLAGFLQYQIVGRDDRLAILDTRLADLKTQVENLEESSRKTEASAEKASTAAAAAQAALEAAIAQSQGQSEGSNQAITRINEIYDTCVVKKEC